MTIIGGGMVVVGGGGGGGIGEAEERPVRGEAGEHTEMSFVE